MTLRTTAAATLTTGTALLALSACGGTPSAADLTKDAKSSSTSAKSTSVDIVGSVNGTRTTFSAYGATNGSNQKQIQTQGKASSEGLVIGKQAYLKANTDFWQQIGANATDAKKLNGKWWKGAANDPASNPALDVKQMLTEFFESEDGKKLASKDAKVAETKTAGKDTYTVSASDAKDAVKLVVTRDDKPQVVKIENYSSKLTNTKANYTFSKWNSVETYKAPSGAKPIASVLGGQSGSGASGSTGK